jgi:hypothetical protein
VQPIVETMIEQRRENSSAGKRAAILQSCYIPWKGYFDIIGMVDVFVIYDDVQYSKNHWHNRNLIKTQHGLKWLTVPVSKTDGAHQTIDRMRVAGAFAQKHWETINQAYARAPFYGLYRDKFAALYREAADLERLSALNELFLKAISAELGFETEFVWSSELAVPEGRTERLVEICRKVGATTYLSGPSAASYLETTQFDAAGIGVEWMDYTGYPQYQQLHGGFEHGVSIIDLLMNAGPEARRFMKSPDRGR